MKPNGSLSPLAVDPSSGEATTRFALEELALAILPHIISAACAIEDGDPSYAHAILLELELNIEALLEAA